MRILLPLLVLALGGCDLLFPELAGKAQDAGLSPDGASSDGGLPLIAGTVCALTDVRDLRSCATIGGGRAGGFRISVEETRDATTTDADGSFTLVLSQPLEIATLGAVDPSGALLPTIAPLRLGGADAVAAIPLLSSDTAQQLAYTGGFPLDQSRGTVLAWAIDQEGAPVAGVHAAPVAGAVGPLYDGLAPGELDPTGPTGSRGLIALFDLAPPSVTLSLATAPSSSVEGDSFELAVRPGAVTISLAVLPPR